MGGGRERNANQVRTRLNHKAFSHLLIHVALMTGRNEIMGEWRGERIPVGAEEK